MGGIPLFYLFLSLSLSLYTMAGDNVRKAAAKENVPVPNANVDIESQVAEGSSVFGIVIIIIVFLVALLTGMAIVKCAPCKIFFNEKAAEAYGWSEGQTPPLAQTPAQPDRIVHKNKHK